MAVIRKSADGVGVHVDLDAGCRLSSLEVCGHELLLTTGTDPIGWGLYPMVPYAGRVGRGRFAFGGEDHQLPLTLGGHAIHGSVYRRKWEAESDSSFVTDLGPEWPFPGWVRQEIRLGADRIALRLEVHAEGGGMPASCGWHPWFRRMVGGAEAVLDIRPGFMFERDDGGVATRKRVPVPDGPWDDCFGDVEPPPVITWPGVVRLEIESTCEFWVVYSERDDALCVEPQTAPPDALNHDAFVVEPGRPLVAECTLRWTGLGDSTGG